MALQPAGQLLLDSRLTCSGYLTIQWIIPLLSVLCAGLSGERMMDIWMIPNQPLDRVFPAKMYGKKTPKKRSMHSHYFAKWPFLHWDEEAASVFCATMCSHLERIFCHESVSRLSYLFAFVIGKML